MTVLETQARKPYAAKMCIDHRNWHLCKHVDMCRTGAYDNLALGRGLSPERRRTFEDAGDGRMKVKDNEAHGELASSNLMDSYALLGKPDALSSGRNVLIYFSPEMKSKVLNQMANSLNPGGYCLGASESLTGLTDRFEMVRCNPYHLQIEVIAAT